MLTDFIRKSHCQSVTMTFSFVQKQGHLPLLLYVKGIRAGPFNPTSLFSHYIFLSSPGLGLVPFSSSFFPIQSLITATLSTLFQSFFVIFELDLVRQAKQPCTQRSGLQACSFRHSASMLLLMPLFLLFSVYKEPLCGQTLRTLALQTRAERALILLPNLTPRQLPLRMQVDLSNSMLPVIMGEALYF